ncbi:hypothetical protein NEHOM01_1235 [Nematocida homosporus]|uniref:uncharacterized protein n=1 Tax=Nematocida homosporus TaxID=1912981 RepID=UPI0022201435|nr:uncharacterized protein NEHOM01_1235 [Nematocida homosporus]KAI5186032.1 hypothetical protein NEHOM01_1235 [Nematocida homosporus]
MSQIAETQELLSQSQIKKNEPKTIFELFSLISDGSTVHPLNDNRSWKDGKLISLGASTGAEAKKGWVMPEIVEKKIMEKEEDMIWIKPSRKLATWEESTSLFISLTQYIWWGLGWYFLVKLVYDGCIGIVATYGVPSDTFIGYIVGTGLVLGLLAISMLARGANYQSSILDGLYNDMSWSFKLMYRVVGTCVMILFAYLLVEVLTGSSVTLVHKSIIVGVMVGVSILACVSEMAVVLKCKPNKEARIVSLLFYIILVLLIGVGAIVAMHYMNLYLQKNPN